MDWKEEFKKKMLGPNIELEDIDLGFALKFKNIPKQLFKYRAFDANDNSLKNLTSDTVWMNSPENFNDPYDCALTFDSNKVHGSSDFISIFYDQLGIDKETQDRELPEFLKSNDPIAACLRYLVSKKLLELDLAEKLIAAIQDRDDALIKGFSDKSKGLTKVCSFSESETSTLMWAHYAQYHTGFCIEYDFTSLGDRSITTRFLYPVFYSELLHDHSDFFININKEKANPLSIVLPVLTKAIDWAYEKEWRLVFSNDSMKQPQLCRIPKATRVYAGVKTSSRDLSKLERVCGELEIPLVKMKISNTSFSIGPAPEQHN